MAATVVQAASWLKASRTATQTSSRLAATSCRIRTDVTTRPWVLPSSSRSPKAFSVNIVLLKANSAPTRIAKPRGTEKENPQRTPIPPSVRSVAAKSLTGRAPTSRKKLGDSSSPTKNNSEAMPTAMKPSRGARSIQRPNPSRPKIAPKTSKKRACGARNRCASHDRAAAAPNTNPGCVKKDETMPPG